MVRPFGPFCLAILYDSSSMGTSEALFYRLQYGAFSVFMLVFIFWLIRILATGAQTTGWRRSWRAVKSQEHSAHVLPSPTSRNSPCDSRSIV